MTEAQRAAMRQALTALLEHGTPYLGHENEYNNAIAALRAALTEPEQEPVAVAWATEIIDALQAQYDTEMIQENDSGDALIRLDQAIAAVEDVEKYYTTPPTRRPLTDAEIDEAITIAGVEGARDRIKKIIRAAERAHGIGGNDE